MRRRSPPHRPETGTAGFAAAGYPVPDPAVGERAEDLAAEMLREAATSIRCMNGAWPARACLLVSGRR
jgi:hypothetical protein